MNIVVDLVCPVYKDLCLLNPLLDSLQKQKNITYKNIVFPITFSTEEETKNIVDLLVNRGIKYFIVDKKDFSHSLTREKAIRDYCDSDIVVMISQDIVLNDELTIYELVKSIYDGETVYNFGRQICKKKCIEKYIREKNYPPISSIIDKTDVEKMQIMAFFASDAFSAYNRDVFMSIGGYGGFDVMMNEDQLYSRAILDAGFKKKYVAEAVVEHSHKYSLKQLYKRYYETGVFYRTVKVFDEYKMSGTGMKLAFYVLKRAFINLDLVSIFMWMPNMAARYFGMRKGLRKQ